LQELEVDGRITLKLILGTDVLKLLGEGGLKIMTKLIKTIFETGEWSKDFTEFTMIALKKPQATECSDHNTISLIAHTAKIVAKIKGGSNMTGTDLYSSTVRSVLVIFVPPCTFERKNEGVLGEDQFGFRRGKGTRDAIGMLRIISERTVDVDGEVCVCCIDWQQAIDRVNWTKLMQILKGTGIDWRERRLISNLYMTQGVKVRLNRGETSNVKTGRGIRQR
jgi:hypothetical protein